MFVGCPKSVTDIHIKDCTIPSRFQQIWNVADPDINVIIHKQLDEYINTKNRKDEVIIFVGSVAQHCHPIQEQTIKLYLKGENNVQFRLGLL